MKPDDWAKPERERDKGKMRGSRAKQETNRQRHQTTDEAPPRPNVERVGDAPRLTLIK